MKLYLADIRQLEGREERGMGLITPERRNTLSRPMPAEDRLHGIAAGLLLRRVLGVREDAQLRRGEFGKPEPVSGEVHFNLSHGGNYAVLAVHSAPLGVDIEAVAETMPSVLPRRALREEELRWLEQDPTPRRFAWLWTRVESALKADGRGLALNQRDFSVLEDGKPWFFQTVCHDTHVISCAAGERFEVRMHSLTAEELLEAEV